MENLLEILESTERLLSEAEKKLGLVKKISKENTAIATKLEPVITKYAELKSKLLEEKTRLFTTLIKLASLTNERIAHRVNIGPCFLYEFIKSENAVRINNGDLRGNYKDISGTYTLDIFLKNPDFYVYYFCKEICNQITKFIKNSPKESDGQIREMTEIVNGLQKLECVRP